jgi:hypothetical protein
MDRHGRAILRAPDFLSRFSAGFFGGLALAYREASWREDHRRTSNGDQTYRVAGLAMKRKQSLDFTGYWQRHVAAN